MPNVSKIGKTIFEQAAMLDTGPLVALYNPRDARGNKVEHTLKEIQRQKLPICIVLPTLAETHRRILYDVGFNQAIKFLEQITDGTITIVGTIKKDIFEAIGIVKRYPDQSISFTDAINMAAMKRIGVRKIFSYDRHYRLLNFTILPE